MAIHWRRPIALDGKILSGLAAQPDLDRYLVVVGSAATVGRFAVDDTVGQRPQDAYCVSNQFPTSRFEALQNVNIHVSNEDVGCIAGTNVAPTYFTSADVENATATQLDLVVVGTPITVTQLQVDVDGVLSTIVSNTLITNGMTIILGAPVAMGEVVRIRLIEYQTGGRGSEKFRLFNQPVTNSVV